MGLPPSTARRSPSTCRAPLELAADHLVAVDEDGHELADEGLPAAHRPRDGGRPAVRLQRELNRVSGFHGLQHFELHSDPGGWRGIGDLDAAFADFAVAAPGVGGALAAIRAAV